VLWIVVSSQASHRVYFDGVFFQVLQKNFMGDVTKFVTLLRAAEWSMSQAYRVIGLFTRFIFDVVQVTKWQDWTNS
jgi:hypothetical protein